MVPLCHCSTIAVRDSGRFSFLSWWYVSFVGSSFVSLCVYMCFGGSCCAAAVAIAIAVGAVAVVVEVVVFFVADIVTVFLHILGVVVSATPACSSTV